MRSSAVLTFAQTARTLSQRRLVRVQLKAEVPGLGRAGSVVLVHPGRMRNELLPAHQAVYQPLPTPFQLASNKANASLVESQLESAQAALQIQQARESLSKELGPVQLLSLRRKLEAAPAIVFSRQTTTKYRPSSSSSVSANGETELPKPALGIQGSISASDVVDFLRQNGAFDLETDFSDEGKDVPLHRLSLGQINTACEFTLSGTHTESDSIDKLGRIKKTGRYTLTAHVLPSNIRVRIPVIVRPNAASTLASASIPSSSSASSPSASTMSGQTRGYATSARPTGMESSMRSKLEAEFGPTVEVNIRNDSSKHAHHAAMAAQGGGNGETHFYVHVVSDKFAGMTQIKRHRAVNALLAAEFERGLHALSLRTKTWAEENRQPASATTQDGQHSTVDEPTSCPRDDDSVARSGSLWTAPQSHLHPTSPLAPTPPSGMTTETNDILSAFYTRPPSAPTVPSPSKAASVTPGQRAKFFRRATKNDALEPSARQNLLNVLGALLATACGTYMVLIADFGQSGAVNCFTDLRHYVWGPQGPPKLF